MQHMSLPDENFQALLQDYASDTADEGFSQLVMAKVERQIERQARAKRICVYGAIFVGGLIAGKQFTHLPGLFDGSMLTSGGSSTLLLPIAAALLIPLTVWLMEQREISL